MAKSGFVSSIPRLMTLDGSNHDMTSANSQVLARNEVIQRHLRRVRQLGRCYRAYYWALMEDMRSKYKEYWQIYGKSPYEEDHEESDNNNPNDNVSGLGGDDIMRCHFRGCKDKAMALTKYCHSHILSDSKQKLYQRCRVVVKSLPTGPAFCNKPVLRSVVSSACPIHRQFGLKCLARALSRARIRNTTPPDCKPNVKLHVIVSEFVRQIQSKRKFALKEIVPKVSEFVRQIQSKRKFALKEIVPKVETE